MTEATTRGTPLTFYDCFEYSAATMARAESILAERWGRPVQLTEARPLWDAPDNCKKNVLRCHLITDATTAPRTVILKRLAEPKGEHDLDTVRPGTLAWRLYGEWGGCRFLRRVIPPPFFSPECYGGDRSQ